ncbi:MULTISPECIES: response regulator transcription factor [Clostridium]|uniref:response regulator transcription factor n=1 Tax=Clostridium TaxID=1485 RepID=UPI000983F3A4|nr:MULTISPECIES: response regulator [Clostridium]AQR97147.1 putative response regulatory protein [Clostridium saccharoperbutylacetonicum]NSB33028.1 two-component system response regulator YesN [Clostridium saccharoperbutylacetonicum]
MWKLVVADDEPKIRRGIENLLDWHELNINIVGEAEDGEIALEVIKEKKPDIILLDINMPFLNGLNLLEKLKEINYRSIVIIISGYDDFSYAQKALKYNVFDYVLKPVNKKNMEEIILKAVSKLNEIQNETNYLDWVEKQLNENIEILKKNFFSEWLDNKLNDQQMLKEIEYFKIKFNNNVGLILVKPIEKLNLETAEKRWNMELLEFAIANLLNEKFNKSNEKFIFNDDKNNVVLIANIHDMVEWINLGNQVEMEIGKYLKCNVLVEQANVAEGILKIKHEYLKIVNDLNKKRKCSPIILLAIKYIEDNYYSNDLSVNDISDKLEVTSSYLSKLLKKETGLSFIDYLTNVRIKKAMCIMEDPSIKIYDVAELVGYSNQHYFCRAFKKVVGISPTEFKRGK